ncbi:MAG: glutathione S-transferase family protein [Alphaproteobacteria bacterium]
MLILHSLGGCLGVKDASPYVLKIHTYLRMAGIEHKTESGLKSFKKSPRKLFPFIEDNGNIITDSYFIMQYLKSHYVDLDMHLSEVQKAESFLYQEVIDNLLYECLLASRWRGENWPKIKQAFFDNLPAPSFVRNMLAGKAQKKVLNRLRFNVDNYTQNEHLQLADEAFKSLSVMLGDNDYMFNNQPSSFDATCFGMLAQFILFELKSLYSKKAENYDNLVQYCHRINKQFFLV